MVPARSAGSRERALAIVSGILLGVAFLPGVPGFVAWGALVPLLIGLERRARRRATAGSLFRLGWLFGFVFFLIGTHWIALLSEVAITVPWLKYPAWVVAAAYLALYSGLATLVAGVLARPAGPRWQGAGPGGAPRVPLALAFPAVLLCVEELRASGEVGFPWFQPGYTQHGYVPLLQLASLGSVSLVTLWVVVLNVLLWRSLAGGARLRSALGALLLVLVPWLWGQRVLQVTAGPAGAAEPARVVALVQGNVAGEIKWSGKHQPEILATFLGLSGEAAGRRPRPVLAIWPETATGSYLRKQVGQALAVAAFAARTGVPVFSGFADYGWDPDGRQRSYNSAGLFASDGSLGPVYAKRHLVPFGERMPFQRLFPWLGRLELGQAEWTPGERTVLFPSAAGPFACLVCFEAIFPDLARADVRAGARWLVNITNDEWFGNSAALYQHAAMSVFRAVENRVPLARCANTGLTLVADASGRVVSTLPVFEPGLLVTELPRPAAIGFPTPYTRFGDWPGLVSLLALVGCALRAAARSR
jgi:apolipoprotein N-acyltransferase